MEGFGGRAFQSKGSQVQSQSLWLELREREEHEVRETARNKVMWDLGGQGQELRGG